MWATGRCRATGRSGIAGRFGSTKHDAGGLTLCRQAGEIGSETRVMQCLVWLLNKLKPLSPPRLPLRLVRFGSSTGCIVHQSEGGASIRLVFWSELWASSTTHSTNTDCCGSERWPKIDHLSRMPKEVRVGPPFSRRSSRGQAFGLLSCH
jgi:hypothetical protein